jgi:flagellar assembly protein FliH
MTSAPAKFHFDLDLSGNQRQTRVMTEALIEELRQKAHEEGFAEGLAQGEHSEVARAAADLSASGQKIAAGALNLLKTVDVAERQARAEGIELARAVGLKLAAKLVAREPEAELEALIVECLASLDRAPHLVVRCNPALSDKLRQITEAHMSAAGFSGRLIVLGDEEIAPGDGRLEWADGGLVRDMATMLAEIDKTIAAYCATTGLPAPSPELAPLAETEHEHD